MNTVNEKRIQSEMSEPSDTWFHKEPGSDVSHLSVIVVATNDGGTLAALRAAGKLAANLGARIALLKTEIVPFQFPLKNPPVSVDFLQRKLCDLVCESGIEGEEVTIQLWLCRDEYECLRRTLPSRSLILVGGRRKWWSSMRTRRLERFIRRLGHQVIFISSPPTKPFWRDWDWESFWGRASANFGSGRTAI